jgi:DNA (cytosine-5)-methyltransferase 1
MGLDLGIESTGHFEIVACVEKVPTFCGTIRLNQRKGRLPEHLRVIEADISQLSPQDVLDAVGLRPEDIDVIVGGPPCQSFSTAGSRAPRVWLGVCRKRNAYEQFRPRRPKD